MGIVSKGAKCNVEGCDQDGARSINTTKVENAGLRVNSTGKKTVSPRASQTRVPRLILVSVRRTAGASAPRSTAVT